VNIVIAFFIAFFAIRGVEGIFTPVFVPRVLLRAFRELNDAYKL